MNVELNADEKLGNRFFLELVLFEVKTKELQRLSEYVYQMKDSKTLCRPKGLVWSPTVKINAIVTAKNQGPWIVHYIQDMARVIHATNDDNVHFVISDYGNNGVDIENEFKRYVNVQNYGFGRPMEISKGIPLGVKFLLLFTLKT